MSRKRFNKDVIRGKEGECYFVLHLLENNIVTKLQFRDYKIWDIEAQVDGKNVTYEVKRDDFSWESLQRDGTIEYDWWGTLFIEFESRGQPSGIAVTKADYFVIVVKRTKQLWVIPTKNLKRLISMYVEPHFIKRGGDYGTSRGYLLPKPITRQYFEIYNYEENYKFGDGVVDFQHRLEQWVGEQNEFNGKSNDPRPVFEVLEREFGIYD
jgi:hypothetical protein